MNSRSMHSALLILLFSILTIVSCKKDIKEDHTFPVPGDPFAIPASTPVTGSVSGIVVNENNAPVEGAEVKLGTTTATTDARGLFSFNNLTLDKYITTVTVNLPGYFKAYRSFSSNATRNYLNIKLIPKVVAGTINSGSGGVVSLANSSKLTFQANSMLIKSTGAAYNGYVNVYASYIDPTASDISAVVPGSFIGSDGNNIYALQSTGMIAVDLESAAGEPLQLAPGLPATMKLPIPSSLLSKAPTAIDTWSLDERGVWKKEGTATKSGNYYETQVTHFSFWNYDAPCNAVYLTLHVQDQNGNALANTLVQLTIPNSSTWWTTTYGYTDSLGNVSGLVPAGMDLQMNIFSSPYTCQGPLNTQTIGPFTSNSSLTVTATIAQSNILTVTGTATDCSGSALQNGTAIIYIGQSYYYYATIANGSYTATITHCSLLDSLNVTVMDNSNSNVGNSGSITISGNSITIPPVSACGSSQGAIFIIGNSGGNCTGGSIAGNFQEGVPMTGNEVVSIIVEVQTPGSYTITSSTTNGMTFSGSGIFTNTGQQFVYLTGSGTPVSSGIYTFQTQALGMVGCNFVIAVNGPQQPQAVFDLGSGVCSNVSINGTYTTGVPLNSSNTATIQVSFTQAGTYSIFTSMANGINFSDSGTITAPGTWTIILQGNGIPANATTEMYPLNSSSGVTGCSFPVTVQAGTGMADFTFDGAPGVCTSASVNGQYTAGTLLNGQNSVTIAVTVITPGLYSVSSNQTNNMNFGGQGTFTTTGPQYITLIASGTPTSPGTYTFIPESPGISGCVFTVPVN